MTIIGIPPANPPLTTIDRRTDRPTPTTTPIRTMRHRLAKYVRNAVRDRQPVVTLSERVLTDIHHVHSLHR
jgi:hypothetical protein